MSMADKKEPKYTVTQNPRTGRWEARDELSKVTGMPAVTSSSKKALKDFLR